MVESISTYLNLSRLILTGGYQIGEHESFPLDGLTDRARDGSRENGTRPGERMELSPLAAWIDVLGKLRQKAGIEFPPRELARKDFRVHASDRGTKPPVHHLLTSSKNKSPNAMQVTPSVRASSMVFRKAAS